MEAPRRASVNGTESSKGVLGASMLVWGKGYPETLSSSQGVADPIWIKMKRNALGAISYCEFGYDNLCRSESFSGVTRETC